MPTTSDRNGSEKPRGTPWHSVSRRNSGRTAAQMTGQDAMRACFQAVTAMPAKILGLDETGLEVGKHADMMLLQALDPVEALRLHATRLMVLRAGVVVATTPPATATLNLPGRPGQVSFQVRA
ncbi:amidohydrolase family protein [Achromobacter ruhlandii]|uniref:amidohydrolase family protein n=1 Tax=Achromobacter ruhlandii TaxID=72557 RepID=UPI003B9D2CFE